MEVATGALPSLLPKLADLLISEYSLQKEVKGGIKFLQTELESMKAAIEEISVAPADKLNKVDKIWAREVRELSYDIEDKIDTFVVRCKDSKLAEQHGINKIISRSHNWLTQPKIRPKISTDIREIKSRVEEVSKRRDRYKVNGEVAKPVMVDLRLLARYEKTTELVGINEARDELIKLMMEGNGMSKQHEKILSIVGFGGLGKTTLANVVYQNLRAQFDCSAFVSVSQTPDMDKLFKNLLYQLGKRNIAGFNVINELREFLGEKRYEQISE
jgi:ATPase subunit of ABC transporter with duplicated ATPase domains